MTVRPEAACQFDPETVDRYVPALLGLGLATRHDVNCTTRAAAGGYQVLPVAPVPIKIRWWVVRQTNYWMDFAYSACDNSPAPHTSFL